MATPQERKSTRRKKKPKSNSKSKASLFDNDNNESASSPMVQYKFETNDNNERSKPHRRLRLLRSRHSSDQGSDNSSLVYSAGSCGSVSSCGAKSTDSSSFAEIMRVLDLDDDPAYLKETAHRCQNDTDNNNSKSSNCSVMSSESDEASMYFEEEPITPKMWPSYSNKFKKPELPDCSTSPATKSKSSRSSTRVVTPTSKEAAESVRSHNNRTGQPYSRDNVTNVVSPEMGRPQTSKPRKSKNHSRNKQSSQRRHNQNKIDTFYTSDCSTTTCTTTSQSSPKANKKFEDRGCSKFAFYPEWWSCGFAATLDSQEEPI